jgi:hypothetical protein
MDRTRISQSYVRLLIQSDTASSGPCRIVKVGASLALAKCVRMICATGHVVVYRIPNLGCTICWTIPVLLERVGRRVPRFLIGLRRFPLSLWPVTAIR